MERAGKRIVAGVAGEAAREHQPSFLGELMASRQQNRIQAYLERNKIGPLFEVRAPPSLRLAGLGTKAAALGSSWRERAGRASVRRVIPSYFEFALIEIAIAAESKQCGSVYLLLGDSSPWSAISDQVDKIFSLAVGPSPGLPKVHPLPAQLR